MIAISNRVFVFFGTVRFFVYPLYLGGNIIIISEALFLDLGSKIHRKSVFLVVPEMTVVITRRQNIPVLGSTIS